MCITNSVKEIRLSTQPYVNSIQRVPGIPTLAPQARDNFDKCRPVSAARRMQAAGSVLQHY